MGRHTAPVPIQPEPPADRGPHVGRHTAPVPVQQGRPLLAAPRAPQVPTARPADAQHGRPLLPGQAPFTPRAARGTPAALPATGPVPRIDAPSLSTAPVPVVARPDRRRPVGRWVAVVAGLVVAGSVAAQFTAQRSLAEPTIDGSTAADTSVAPTTDALSARTSALPSAAPTPSDSGTSPSADGPVASAGPTLSFGPIPRGPSDSATPTSSSTPSASDGSPTSTPTASRGSASPSASASPRDSSTPSASAAPSASATPSETPSSPRPTEASPTPSESTPQPTGDAGTVRSLRAAASDANGKDLDLGAGIWRFDDFRDDLLGVHLTGSLTGSGSGRTTLSMSSMSSSRRSAVPKKDWTTNQLSLIKVSGAKEISGFTLRGTPQGHLYNGLRISKSSGTKVHDVKVTSVPGNDDIPPGETFGINDFHTDGTRYSHVEVDGDGVSSADFGTNSSSNTTITDSWFHDSGHANGATFWQTRNVTVRDTRSTGNYDTGFNFERVSGDVLLDHVTMKDNRLAHIRINSDKGSADFRIVDPVFDGPKLKILMTPRYMGSPNLQKRSDVTVIIDGVDRTDDVVQWVTHF